jgi:hypothetical protein
MNLVVAALPPYGRPDATRPQPLLKGRHRLPLRRLEHHRRAAAIAATETEAKATREARPLNAVERNQAAVRRGRTKEEINATQCSAGVSVGRKK